MNLIKKKRVQSVTMAIAAFAAIAIAGCTQNDLPVDDNNNRTALSVQVTDGGYAPATGEQPHTRAAESGYKTLFTAGDKIGLYVVKNGTPISENICLTAADNGSGGISWTLPESSTLWYEGANAGITYYAYYPYQADMTGKVTTQAADATGFFQPLVSGWTPDTDQSTYAKYTAQDLMTGSGTLSGSGSARTLTLTLAHQMALAVIETPVTRYELSTDENYSWNVAPPGLTFNSFTPYTMVDGSHRYLVKPSTSNKLSGSYSNFAGGRLSFSFTPTISASAYCTYKVDGGLATVERKTHTLQTGDFYMKDGWFIGKDETLTDTEKDACVGVVYWVGDITGDDPLLKRNHPGCTHGLVVALNDAGVNSHWSSSYEDISPTWLNSQSGTYGISTLKDVDKMQGYANTKALEGYNKTVAVESKSGYKVLPIGLIDTYESNHPAPANSSGWYWPSIKELKYMCWGQRATNGTAGKTMLNIQFDKVGSGATSLQSDFYYWSSTENGSNYAWLVYFYNGNKGYGNKYNRSYGVRAVVAF